MIRENYFLGSPNNNFSGARFNRLGNRPKRFGSLEHNSTRPITQYIAMHHHKSARKLFQSKLLEKIVFRWIQKSVSVFPRFIVRGHEKQHLRCCKFNRKRRRRIRQTIHILQHQCRLWSKGGGYCQVSIELENLVTDLIFFQISKDKSVRRSSLHARTLYNCNI